MSAYIYTDLDLYKKIIGGIWQQSLKNFLVL
jgi:hypothetical protein